MAGVLDWPLLAGFSSVRPIYNLLKHYITLSLLPFALGSSGRGSLNFGLLYVRHFVLRFASLLLRALLLFSIDSGLLGMRL